MLHLLDDDDDDDDNENIGRDICAMLWCLFQTNISFDKQLNI